MALAGIAVLAVASGFFQPPQPDEGSAAHIFQLAIAALLPMTLLFVFSADWKHPARSARQLALVVAMVMVAFGALFYLEHVFYPLHYQ